MTEKIKEEIERIKSRNGNANFTIKEMFWYLMSRQDKTDAKINKIFSKFEKGSGKIAANREAIKQQEKSNGLIWKFIYGLIFAIIGLAFGTIWPF